jgi:hypothetical protein
MGLSDLEDAGRKLAESATQKVALSAGKDLARRALDDLTLSPEQKAARDQQAARTTKKRLVLGVVAVTAVAVVGIGLLQLLASLWLWAIGFVVVAGVLGVVALLVKPRIDAIVARVRGAHAERTARALAAARQKEQQQAEAEAHAREQAAKAQAAQKLEDELARLKRQAGA